MARYSIGISFLVLLINTGCLKYQYVSLDSNLNRTKSSQFIYENDSIRIKHWFAGEDCPIQIEVFNKLKTPLYADWKKSALIINEQRFSYWKDESILTATSNDYSISWTKRVSTGGSQTEGTLSRDEQISFIPPQSLVTVSPILVKSDFFKLPEASKANKISLTPGGLKAMKYSYLQENSPLKFRSYLTLSTTEDFKSPIALDNHFWVTEILQTNTEPYLVPNKTDNQFYMKESTDFGKFAIGLIGVLIIIGALVLSTGS